MARILLAEDDEIMRISIYDRLRAFGWRVDEAQDGLEAKRLSEENEYNLVISDIRMPGLDGLALLQLLLHQCADTEVIIMTAYGSVDGAIDCLRQGASDYILKPFDMDDLIIRVSRLLEAQAVRARCEALEASCLSQQDRELIGDSEPMRRVYALIDQVAATDATVLITGESGTGKELAARAIHRLSPRRDKPFVSINCAAIPEGLMESELFGHERGSFTGADQRRKGKFELADGGTLLLDELGDLPGPLQAKLLRVLQESSFERVGGNRSISVDVRILACTAKDLRAEVLRGAFREDLLYRLQVIPLQMPPLREHLQDLAQLCYFFLQEFNLRNRRSLTIAEEAIGALQSYHFPGNVRELRNIMERASVLCRHQQITAVDLPAEIAGCSPSPVIQGATLAEHLADAEQQYIRATLAKTGGNRTEAAKLLGISRKNLWEKQKLYGLP